MKQKATAVALVMLSCLFSSGSLSTSAGTQSSQASSVTYSCPMDPDVKSKEPGKCPKCGMALRQTSGPERSTRGMADRERTGLSLKFPDTIVYDHNGKKFRFYSDLVEGKTVAITFIFTTCTTICPPLTANLRKVQQELGGRIGTDLGLISVTIDPVIDVPKKLKAFSDRFGAQPGWSFVTGGKAEMEKLLKALGGPVDKDDHTPVVLVCNGKTGFWTRTYGLAPPSKIVEVINDVANK